MGCYDEVVFKCPSCKQPIRIQSKAGDCRFDTIPCRSVPPAIAVAIADEETYCTKCSLHLVVKPITPIHVINMELVEWEPKISEEDEE